MLPYYLIGFLISPSFTAFVTFILMNVPSGKLIRHLFLFPPAVTVELIYLFLSMACCQTFLTVSPKFGKFSGSGKGEPFLASLQ